MKYYKLNINSLSDKQYKDIYNQIDPVRREKCDLLKKIDDKKRCLGIHHLIIKTFADEYEVNISNIDYSNDYPIIPDSDYNISVSHCDDWIVLAVSKNLVGIDIEKIRPINFDINRYFCSDDDLDYIGNDYKKLFDVWTFKEAFFKARRTGISRKSKTINFRDHQKSFDTFDNYTVCLYEKTQE